MERENMLRKKNINNRFMKIIAILIIVSCIFEGCRTKNANVSRIPYEINDVTKNIYLTDSIKLDMNYYTIIRSYKTGHSFIIPNEMWTAHNFSEKQIMNNPSCYYLELGLWNSTYQLYSFAQNTSNINKKEGEFLEVQIIQEPNKNKTRQKTYNRLQFRRPPSFFYLMLVRGDALKCLNKGLYSDAKLTTLRLSDEKCYYKVLRPVWK